MSCFGKVLLVSRVGRSSLIWICPWPRRPKAVEGGGREASAAAERRQGQRPGERGGRGEEGAEDQGDEEKQVNELVVVSQDSGHFALGILGWVCLPLWLQYRML